MKIYLYIILILSSLIALNSCSKDDDKTGNPVIDTKTQFANAMFGDSITFTANVSDNEVPLSTLKARMYYGEEMVSEVVIRTKEEGEYTGKIFAPFFANIPNGKATITLVLQNINQTVSETSHEISLSRPDFPHLTFVTKDEEIRMNRTGENQYAVTQTFPIKIQGYIKAPAVGANGNEITFGWEENSIKEATTDNIQFSNSEAGEYTITFNTLSYEATPFIINYSINDELMEKVDNDNFKLDMDLTKGKVLEIKGIDDLSDWWIDPDFLTKKENGMLAFATTDGKYRITANFENKYFKVEAMTGNDLATLQADGTGAIWILGGGIGKPVLKNAPGWSPGSGICMAPIGNGKYQVTVVAGTTIKADEVDFKFFHQNGWGGEFGGTSISTTSDVIIVKDSGNLAIADGKTLVDKATYVLTIDVSKGINSAVLTVDKK